jgi:hypothetical protein
MIFRAAGIAMLLCGSFCFAGDDTLSVHSSAAPLERQGGDPESLVQLRRYDSRCDSGVDYAAQYYRISAAEDAARSSSIICGTISAASWLAAAIAWHRTGRSGVSEKIGPAAVATLFSAVAFGFTVKFGLDIVTLSTSPGKKEAVRGCVGTKKPSNGSGPEAGKRSEGY